MVFSRRQNRQIILTSALILILSACNYQADKTSDEGTSDSQTVPDETVELNFRIVQENVFFQLCQRCHEGKGKFTFESYPVVLAKLAEIEHTVFVEQSMPPSGRISESQKAVLRAWIDAGGPE